MQSFTPAALPALVIVSAALRMDTVQRSAEHSLKALSSGGHSGSSAASATLPDAPTRSASASSNEAKQHLTEPAQSVDELFPEDAFEDSESDPEVDEFGKRLELDWQSCLSQVLRPMQQQAATKVKRHGSSPGKTAQAGTSNTGQQSWNKQQAESALHPSTASERSAAPMATSVGGRDVAASNTLAASGAEPSPEAVAASGSVYPQPQNPASNHSESSNAAPDDAYSSQSLKAQASNKSNSRQTSGNRRVRHQQAPPQPPHQQPSQPAVAPPPAHPVQPPADMSHLTNIEIGCLCQETGLPGDAAFPAPPPLTHPDDPPADTEAGAAVVQARAAVLAQYLLSAAPPPSSAPRKQMSLDAIAQSVPVIACSSGLLAPTCCTPAKGEAGRTGPDMLADVMRRYPDMKVPKDLLITAAQDTSQARCTLLQMMCSVLAETAALLAMHLVQRLPPSI